MDYKTIITNYIKTLGQETLLTKCYNEKSFQHELGQYIQTQLGDGFIVQYERNANYFNCTRNNKYFKEKDNKKELDIVVLKRVNDYKNLIDSTPECSIEIKFQKYYPESLLSPAASPTKTLYEYLRDIELIEQCKINGFKNTYSIFLADHPFCYKERKNKVKYEHLHNAFRGDSNTGINKNTLKDINNEIIKYGQWRKLDIKYNYDLKWHKLIDFFDEKEHTLVLKYIIEEGKKGC